MQETGNRAMSPYMSSSNKFESPVSSRTSSPTIGCHQPMMMMMEDVDDEDDDNVSSSKCMSEDEISVGCPSPMPKSASSPAPQRNNDTTTSTTASITTDLQDIVVSGGCRCPESSDPEDYFKPLKKLKMVDSEIERRRRSLDDVPADIDVDVADDSRATSDGGVKSFSIVDILNHRPATKAQPTRIVRPWDLDTTTNTTIDEDDVVPHHNHHHNHHHSGSNHLHHHHSNHHHHSQHHHNHHHGNHLERFHRQLKVQQQLALLRPEFASAFANASYTSETGSDRSSSVASDCCSPDIVVPSAAAAAAVHSQRQRVAASSQKTPSGTPLDALFQMTSKTFDSNAAETNADGQSHLNLFNNRQQPKKKRKSRTAFTNHQIFELEKRFLYQKYLSPADRDEIASSLGLTNAQVITWFQNRRAKLKRDMEELKKDVESAKILTAHKSFLENVQDLGILKKKAILAAAASTATASDQNDDCPKNLIVAHDK